MTITRTTGYAAAAAFIASIVAANYVTTRYGFVGVGLGLTAAAGTYLAGLALGLRDVIQEGLGRWGVLAVIGIGAVASALAVLLLPGSVPPGISTSRILIASTVALLVSELADWRVYQPLRERGMWPAAVGVSNTVGAIIDTLLFLSIAGFLSLANVEGQLVGKIVWATLVPLGVIYVVRSARQSVTA